jgi:hypothetical protein
MKRSALLLQCLAVLAVVACSTSPGEGFGDSGQSMFKKDGGKDGDAYVKIPTGGPDSTVPLMGGDGGDPGFDASGPCPYTATDTTDHDGDGWSGADGDCNDCNKYINPGAYDIPGDNIDQDCDGTPDDEPTGCDSTVGVTTPATIAGSDGAMAIDLCRTTTASAPLPQKTWGVISSTYVTPDGTNGATDQNFNMSNFMLGFGILGPTFGDDNSTQQGVRMLGLSSGTARRPVDPGYIDVSGFNKGFITGAPTGFPGSTPACGSVMFGAPHDGAALSVVLRVPTNALALSFDSNFFSYEFPDYVCSSFNDTYVVIITPSPAGEPTSAHGNVAYDSNGNIISVNAGFLQVCDPTSTAGGMDNPPQMVSYACTEGPSKLLGTGFGIDTTSVSPSGDDQNHASTDWLETTVAVNSLAGQTVTILFALWDSSDGELDSTVLIDNVHWTFLTMPNASPPPPMAPTTAPK